MVWGEITFPLPNPSGALMFSFMVAWTSCWSKQSYSVLTHNVKPLQWYHDFKKQTPLFIQQLLPHNWHTYINVLFIIIHPYYTKRFTPWWRHQMEIFSAPLAYCVGNHRSPVDSPHKGQWRRALMFSFSWAWTNGWVNIRKAGDLRRHRAHYGVTVMLLYFAIWPVVANVFTRLSSSTHDFTY